jgi:aldehyde:ferredoxin oxidoreductase
MLLRVDLTKEEICTEELDDSVLRKFLGGSGLAAKILWDETTADTDPLSEENVLIFAVGPMTGTAVPSSSRLVSAAVSPQTNIWGEAHAGGSCGAALGRTGYMAVVVAGRASRPVYLWVRDNEAQIVDAGHLWGTDTYEVYDLLLRETDSKACVAAIGPAGENLVRFASIMCDGPAAHALARSGMGAVMGSKNLKALVISGTGRPAVYDDKKLKASINRFYPKLHKREPGEEILYFKKRASILDERAPVKNHLFGEMQSFAEMQRDVVKPAFEAAEYHFCSHCRSGCIMPAEINGKRLNHGESMFPIGSNCLIDDFEALNEAFEICNRSGLDTITFGDTIAFAMELFEKGIITREDTEGIELTWGNGKAMLQTLQNIIDDKGIGKLLRLGVKRAAEEIGGLAPEYAMHVKGLEFSLHDPRAWNHYALQTATANRGADHQDGEIGLYEAGLCPGGQPPAYGYTHIDDENARKAYDNPFAVEGVGKLVAWSQNFTNLIDSLVTCSFIGFPGIWINQPVEEFGGVQPEHIAEWLSHITGLSFDMDEVMLIGERIFNLKRLFNIRRGISGKDDTLPRRMLIHKRGGKGRAADNLPPLGRMLNEYYSYRSWSEEGIPTMEKLSELGLQSIKSLKQLNGYR